MITDLNPRPHALTQLSTVTDAAIEAHMADMKAQVEGSYKLSHGCFSYGQPMWVNEDKQCALVRRIYPTEHFGEFDAWVFHKFQRTASVVAGNDNLLTDAAAASAVNPTDVGRLHPPFKLQGKALLWITRKNCKNMHDPFHHIERQLRGDEIYPVKFYDKHVGEKLTSFNYFTCDFATPHNETSMVSVGTAQRELAAQVRRHSVLICMYLLVILPCICCVDVEGGAPCEDT